MRIGFYGGVGEVTGSRHLLEAEGMKILLDCGMFQGHREEAREKNARCPFDASSVDVLLLSHAHMDHCGNIPALVKNGFKGSIRCTPASLDIAKIMLADSARLQEQDAFFYNKLHAKDGKSITPLYTQEDVDAALRLFEPAPFEEWVSLSPKIRFRFHNAGHVLGSAMIEVEVRTAQGKRTVFFTGDLGRRKALLMDSPHAPKDVDYLLIESTYGDRAHETVDDVEGIMKGLVDRAVREGGKILIPSFALERTQEIVFVLEKMIRHGQIPRIPVYVDSPMAVSVSALFTKYLTSFSFSPEFKDYVAKEGDPFDFKAVHYVKTSQESMALNDAKGPMIILSASGMCEGGRILHHLRNNIENPKTTILIVGYQGVGTLGRRLQEGAKIARIFDLTHPVNARVQTLHTFSAHADRDDLLWFMKTAAPRPRTIFLVHGDPADRIALKGHLAAEGLTAVETPEYGQTFDLA